jgi:hypothetical protein
VRMISHRTKYPSSWFMILHHHHHHHLLLSPVSSICFPVPAAKNHALITNWPRVSEPALTIAPWRNGW